VGGAVLDPGWPVPESGTAVAPEGLASTMGPWECGIDVGPNLGGLFQPQAAGIHRPSLGCFAPGVGSAFDDFETLAGEQGDGAGD